MRTFLILKDPLRIEALSDEDKVEEEDSAFTMKKRAATVGEKDILAKLAPPPPVERTRRGDSLGEKSINLSINQSINQSIIQSITYVYHAVPWSPWSDGYTATLVLTRL